jgi:thiamine-phosphate pyrophosphorylase
VSFAGEPETLLDVAGWWAALMTVPCVAEGVADPDQAGALAAAGAEFVMPAAGLWTSPLPDAGFEAIAQAIRVEP